jgi:hypothetical protein
VSAHSAAPLFLFIFSLFTQQSGLNLLWADVTDFVGVQVSSGICRSRRMLFTIGSGSLKQFIYFLMTALLSEVQPAPQKLYSLAQAAAYLGCHGRVVSGL